MGKETIARKRGPRRQPTAESASNSIPKNPQRGPTTWIKQMLTPSGVVTGTILGMSIFANAGLFPQFATVDDIPKEYFANHKTIYGHVVRVIDGDTIRIRHCPTRFASCNTSPAPPSKNGRERIYDSTLSIRLYGVDAPELQKRKSEPPSQPMAEEAKEYVSNLVLNDKVRVKLLRKDRYGRALAKVETTPSIITKWIVPRFLGGGRKDLSIELMEQGLAVLYEGGGAEYDSNKEILEQKQNKAKRKRRGIWTQGNKIVSPAEYKQQKQKLLQTSGVSRK